MNEFESINLVVWDNPDIGMRYRVYLRADIEYRIYGINMFKIRNKMLGIVSVLEGLTDKLNE